MNINNYPKCNCGGDLLPVEDTSRDYGSVFLKGWFCPVCKLSWLSKAGSIIEIKIVEDPEKDK